jgi:copper oxidase (laccase) domain-containing protein
VLNFTKSVKGKALLDLTQVNLQLILKAGLNANNIETSELCTYTLKDDFYSARRDGNITGRMINCISLNI